MISELTYYLHVPTVCRTYLRHTALYAYLSRLSLKRAAAAAAVLVVVAVAAVVVPMAVVVASIHLSTP